MKPVFCVFLCVCALRSVNEGICAGHFLNPAEAQSVHQTWQHGQTDSTPFHKNVVQPTAEIHTQKPQRWFSSPTGAIYSHLRQRRSMLVSTLLLTLLVFALGTHSTLYSIVTRVSPTLALLAPLASIIYMGIWCCHWADKLSKINSCTCIAEFKSGMSSLSKYKWRGCCLQTDALSLKSNALQQ